MTPQVEKASNPTTVKVCACPYCQSKDIKKATTRETGGHVFMGVFNAGEGMQVENDGVSQFNCKTCKAVFYAEAKQALN